MTTRRFSLGPRTETTGEGYLAFKAKLEELRRKVPIQDPQEAILAQETHEDDLGAAEQPLARGEPHETDPDLAAGIYGMNDGGYDGD